ncbi:MAG: CRISPR-associated endoribonuclease Cas6 [Leptolyngbyaceae cyanobacterium RU_5_1]|nr:CRISPR-associated endoribonuclease Cas6 [Leptolyngbyaceae cyanobacterium RU_5_1]
MPSTRSSSRKLKQSDSPKFKWAADTELVGLTLKLQPTQDFTVLPQYTTELHSWWLDQVRRMDHALSSYLHDGQSEKPFTISQLHGSIQSQGRSLHLAANQTYQWTVTVLSKPVVEWLANWLITPPTNLHLRSGSFTIIDWSVALPPTTYTQLLPTSLPEQPTITLSFLTPTSFRRKGNHLPLPIPMNVFQSYLRRWNDFSSEAIDQEDFLDWVDEFVMILRHQIQTSKVMAGKRGAVTGFIGSIQFGLSAKAKQDESYTELWLALGQLAPYCGTGHNTTFGLGQTTLGWLDQTETLVSPASIQDLLAQRVAELTERFIAQRKRTGGDRATTTAQTWATILARRDLGESLQDIAQDLEMPYETVKTYAKLARRALNR